MPPGSYHFLNGQPGKFVLQSASGPWPFKFEVLRYNSLCDYRGSTVKSGFCMSLNIGEFEILEIPNADR